MPDNERLSLLAEVIYLREKTEFYKELCARLVLAEGEKDARPNCNSNKENSRRKH